MNKEIETTIKYDNMEFCQNYHDKSWYCSSLCYRYENFDDAVTEVKRQMTMVTEMLKELNKGIKNPVKKKKETSSKPKTETSTKEKPVEKKTQPLNSKYDDVDPYGHIPWTKLER